MLWGVLVTSRGEDAWGRSILLPFSVWGIIKGGVKDAKYLIMLWILPSNEELTFLKCQ